MTSLHTSDDEKKTRKPLFIYGNLQAPDLLARILMDDTAHSDLVAPLLRDTGKVRGYSRYRAANAGTMGYWWPCALPTLDSPGSFIEGHLVTLEDDEEYNRVMAFQARGKGMNLTPVVVTLKTGEKVDADMYVWDEKEGAITREPWSLSEFIEEGGLDRYLLILEPFVFDGHAWARINREEVDLDPTTDEEWSMVEDDITSWEMV